MTKRRILFVKLPRSKSPSYLLEFAQAVRAAAKRAYERGHLDAQEFAHICTVLQMDEHQAAPT